MLKIFLSRASRDDQEYDITGILNLFIFLEVFLNLRYFYFCYGAIWWLRAFVTKLANIWIKIIDSIRCFMFCCALWKHPLFILYFQDGDGQDFVGCGF